MKKNLITLILLFFSFYYLSANESQFIGGATMYQQKESAKMDDVSFNSICTGFNLFFNKSIKTINNFYSLCIPFNEYMNSYLNEMCFGFGTGIGLLTNLYPIENLSYKISSIFLCKLKANLEFEIIPGALINNLLIGIEADFFIFGTDTQEGSGSGVFFGIYPLLFSFNKDSSVKPDEYYRMILGISVCMGRR